MPRLVDRVKAELIVVPVSACGPLIAAGAVTIDGRVGRIDDVVAGEQLAVDPAAIADLAFAAEDVALTIVAETADYLVVDKPHGMHVHPLGAHRTGTLLNALLHHAGARPDRPWGAWRPHPIHRLDRAASGLTVIAKSAAVAARVVVTRRYRAVVGGIVARDAGTIDAPLGRDPACDYRRCVRADGQRAVTHYRVVQRDAAAGTTVVELALETGRTHQIRAHLASLGHAIVGDDLYAAAATPTPRIELRAIALELRYGDELFTWTAADSFDSRPEVSSQASTTSSPARESTVPGGIGAQPPVT